MKFFDENFIEKLNFIIFFRKFVTKNRASGNNTIFLQLFRFRGGVIFPLSPWLRPCIQRLWPGWIRVRSQRIAHLYCWPLQIFTDWYSAYAISGRSKRKKLFTCITFPFRRGQERAIMFDCTNRIKHTNFFFPSRFSWHNVWCQLISITICFTISRPLPVQGLYL